MNGEALGAFAELLGVLVVVLSLVYLARQIAFSDRLAPAEASRSLISDLRRGPDRNYGNAPDGRVILARTDASARCSRRPTLALCSRYME